MLADVKTLRPGKFGPYGGQFVPETLMPALPSWKRLTWRCARSTPSRPSCSAT